MEHLQPNSLAGGDARVLRTLTSRHGGRLVSSSGGCCKPAQTGAVANNATSGNRTSLRCDTLHLPVLSHQNFQGINLP